VRGRAGMHGGWAHRRAGMRGAWGVHGWLVIWFGQWCDRLLRVMDQSVYHPR
jgi:hypothetical protein